MAGTPIFGTPAKFGSFINWFNPVPLFIQCFVTKTSEPLQPTRYCICVIVLLTQNFFARGTSNYPLMFTSKIGGLIFFAYSTLAFMMKKQRIQFLIFLSLLVAEMMILYNMSCEILGSTLCLIQCISSIGPYETIMKAIKTKNPSYLNPVSLALNFICSFFWLAYGVEIRQMALIIPNLVEMAIVTFQIALFIKFRNHYHNENRFNQILEAIKSCETINLKEIDIEKAL